MTRALPRPLPSPPTAAGGARPDDLSLGGSPSHRHQGASPVISPIPPLRSNAPRATPPGLIADIRRAFAGATRWEVARDILGLVGLCAMIGAGLIATAVGS